MLRAGGLEVLVEVVPQVAVASDGLVVVEITVCLRELAPERAAPLAV
jgi:hypothetical protein